MKYIPFLLLLLIAFGSHAQNTEQYNTLVKEAMDLYQKKEYELSAEKFSNAFEVLDGKAYSTDRYNAACSYSLAGNVDTAFYHLFSAARNSEYDNYNHITTDRDLNLLHTDPRWEELLAIIKENKEKAEASLDKELVAILETILLDDQKYRKQIDSVMQKFGWESAEMKDHLKLMDKADSINLLKISKILDERGWLGKDVIGSRGNMTLFLVIQHADLETQLKYLPLMREAVNAGNAFAHNLAMLEDRVALRQGKKQIYGSQLGQNPESGTYYVLPLEDPENVDKRRYEAGLPPMNTYLSNWNLEWNLNEYYANIPEADKEKYK